MAGIVEFQSVVNGRDDRGLAFPTAAPSPTSLHENSAMRRLRKPARKQGCLQSSMRSEGDAGQRLLTTASVSRIARLLPQCPVDGSSPNSKRLGDGRRADAILLERPHL